MKKLILSLGLFFTVFTVHAQKVGSTVQIETKDNNRIKGTVIEKTETHLTIESPSTGNITIERNKIRNIEEINVIDAGRFSYENQHASRNLMTPTAFGVRKGEGYFKNTELFFQSVNYGITDHLSIGASSDISGLLTSNRSPFLITLNTKLSTNVGKNAAIAGGLTMTRIKFSNELEGVYAGILYSVITFGNKNHNLTIGGGFPLIFNKEARNELSNPKLLTLSGQYRFTDNWFFITENWMSPNQGIKAIAGATGFRYMRNGFAFDFAIPYLRVNTSDSNSNIVEGGVSPIPFVSATISF